VTSAEFNNTLDDKDGMDFDIGISSRWLYIVVTIVVICCGTFLCKLCGEGAQNEGGEKESSSNSLQKSVYVIVTTRLISASGFIASIVIGFVSLQEGESEKQIYLGVAMGVSSVLLAFFILSSYSEIGLIIRHGD